MPLFDAVAGVDVDLVHVGIQANDALAMVDENHVAAEEEVTGINDGAISGGFNRRANFGGDIEAVVRLTFLFIKKAS